MRRSLPPGTGAVAIVRLSGPEAIRIVRAIWRPLRPRAAFRAHTLYLGEVRNPATGASIDRALGVVMPAPRSLTGEDVVELHCHGGAYLVRRVIALAMAHGARMAEPGEFSRRAFLNGRMDLTEAEAIADLIAARSDSALEQAITQLGGALAERVGRLRAGVIGIRAHLEAEIDFADEDVDLPSREQIAAAIADLAADIRVLHDSFARGRLMREGARATIVGKPNVGKSSILNLLLGAERAIVTPIPGTTRDVIEDSISSAHTRSCFRTRPAFVTVQERSSGSGKWRESGSNGRSSMLREPSWCSRCSIRRGRSRPRICR